jgi:hypothetical protein
MAPQFRLERVVFSSCRKNTEPASGASTDRQPMALPNFEITPLRGFSAESSVVERLGYRAFPCGPY